MAQHGGSRSVAVMAGHADRIDDGVVARIARLCRRRVLPPHRIGVTGPTGNTVRFVVWGI